MLQGVLKNKKSIKTGFSVFIPIEKLSLLYRVSCFLPDKQNQ